jgi:hypothetical protein
MSLALSSLGIRLPNLGAGLSLETLVSRWRRDLASCLPGRLGEFLAPRDTHLTLVLGEGQALLRQGLEVSGHRLSELDEGSRATLGALVAGRDAEPRTCIELPANWIITRPFSCLARRAKICARSSAMRSIASPPFIPTRSIMTTVWPRIRPRVGESAWNWPSVGVNPFRAGWAA